MMNDLKSLVQTVLELRSKKYPQISKQLLVELLTIESEYISDEAEALKRIEREVESYLNKEGI
jgi:hypothetical protein